MTRPTIATLSTENIRHNAHVIRERIAPAKLIAMVKSNAYGHGIRSVAKRLEGYVDMFGVASIDEALILRSIGIQTPILLAEGVFEAAELVFAAQEKFDVVFHDQQQLAWLQEVVGTHRLSEKLQVWIKINTGMGRLGFDAAHAKSAYKVLMQCEQVKQPIGTLSHFACSDQKDHPLNQVQIAAFTAFVRDLQHDGPLSFCNSAALFNFPDLYYDYVRAGIALYGVSPIAGIAGQDLGFKPVMTFRTKLISVKTMQKGASIGYGARYECPDDMQVGVIACGYGDGYPLTARDGTPVLINGVECPIIGRVSMDMITVDLRGCPSAQVGDCVVLWGEGLPIEKVVTHTSEIVWNMLTALQLRVKFAWE